MKTQQIKKLLSVALLGASITFIGTGCVAAPKAVEPTNGTITKIKLDDKISTDTAEFLSKEYAPANTIFNIADSITHNDPFKVKLLEKLRVKGFEIQENQVGAYNNLNFIVDNNLSLGIIRVVLIIDNHKYAKAFDLHGKSLSSWSLIKN